MRLFFHRVEEELARATLKYPDETETLSLAEWYCVLAEEVGEVARPINKAGLDRQNISPAALENMRYELVQVAAMAFAMYDSAGRVLNGASS